MYLKDYYPSDLDSMEYQLINNNMGHYSVGIHEGQTNGRPNRTAYSTGHAYVKKLGGGTVEVKVEKSMRISNDSSLSICLSNDANLR